MAAGFLKEFPMLEEVLIESWQEGMGTGNPYTQTLPRRAYGLPRYISSPIISCANRNCRDGGFDVLADISKMIRERLTTKEFVQVCCGDEKSPSGPGGNCINTLHYRGSGEGSTLGSKNSRAQCHVWGRVNLFRL